MIKRLLAAAAFLAAVSYCAWALSPSENIIITSNPSATLSIITPANGSIISGTVLIKGIIGSQWVNVGAFDNSNGGVKVAADVVPSNNAFTLTLPTATMANGSHSLAIIAFGPSPNAFVNGATASFLLTVIVSNGGAPANTAAPSIAGGVQVGNTLTLTRGTWTNAPTSYADQWQSNGTPISGATGLTYVPVTGDIGNLINVVETASNASGTSSPATSASLGPIVAAGAGGNAVAANTFLNSIGVNMNNCYQVTATIPTWCAGAITYMGIRSLRMIGYQDTGGVTTAAEIAFAQATGAKWIVGLDSTPAESTSALITSELLPLAEQAAAAGVLIAIEGANEPINWPVLWNGVYGGGGGNVKCPTNGGQCSWVPVAQQQAALYSAVKADTTNGVNTYPVWNSAGYIEAELDNVGLQCLRLNTSECANAGAVSLMPANTTYADAANEHNYVIVTGGTISPVNNQAWLTAGVQVNPAGITLNIWNDMGVTATHGYLGHSTAQIAPGVMPRVTTETGWYMPAGVAQSIGAKMLLNVLLSQFKLGYQYTFIYEVGDCTYNVDPFGLYACTSTTSATPKPAATDIHNLTTVLADTANFTTGTLPYSIASEPVTVHDLLLQKSTGAFELIVWDEQCPSGSNAGANCTQPPPTQNITVNLGGAHSQVNTYDPTVGTSPVAPCYPTTPCSGISSVVLPLNDHPMIVEVIN